MAIALLGCLALTFEAAVGPAHSTNFAAPTLKAWQRAEEGHLIVEWTKAIRVQQKTIGDRLILRFADPLNADVQSALLRLTHFVHPDRSSLEGTDLSLALKPGVSSKVNIRERRIVAINFVRDLAGEPQLGIDIAAIDNGARLTFNWPGPTGVATDRTADQTRLTITPGWPVDPVELMRLRQSLMPWLGGLDLEQGNDQTRLAFTPQPQVVASVRAEGPMRTSIEFRRQASTHAEVVRKLPKPHFLPEKRPEIQAEKKPEAVAVNDEPEDPGPPIPMRRPAQAEEPSAVAAIEEQAGENAASPDLPASLLFAWTKPVAASVFIRANHLWVVFDSPDRSSLSSWPKSAKDVGPGSFVRAEGGTALRYPLRRPLNIQTSQPAEGHWLIEAVESPSLPQPFAIERADGSTALQIAPLSGKRMISVIDPSVGDQLEIMPVADPGSGQPERRRYVDLELLPTAQGLVWRALDDRLVASLEGKNLKLHSPDGLSLSSVDKDGKVLDTIIRKAMADKGMTDEKAPLERQGDENEPEPVVRPSDSQLALAQAPPPAEVPRPASYFNLAGSGVERELVNEYRRIRRQAITNASPEKRDAARLRLARLLVSERLATEARTILQAISEEADDVVLLQKQALNGVAALLIGHFAEASSLLLDPGLNDDDEIDIWRAALESTEDKWQPAAERWQATSDILDDYPMRLKLELGLMALEAAIETDDDKMIRRGMRRLSSLPLDPYDEARFDAMKALKAERSGDLERARALLTGLTDSPNPTIRALADFELASLKLSADPKDSDVLVALGRRMPLWRGHPEEPTMLDQLARRYVDVNALRKALTIWRRLIQLYPKVANSDDLKKARQEAYIQALKNENHPTIDPVDVYAIYLDFIDLLPGDPEVRKVQRHLARHLTELDLVSEAIDVLQSLMATTDDPAEKAEFGIDIAVLMLRQDRASSTLAVLDETDGTGQASLAPSIREQRQLVRAQALARLDRPDDALRALRDLPTDPAHRLRAKILWDQRRWTRLAATVDSYFADADLTSPLTTEEQELVLWLAIARQREADKDKLISLRTRFADAMRSSMHAEAFDVATQNVLDMRDIGSYLATTGEQLVELQRFRETP